MTGFTVFIYIIFLIIFSVTAALIFRHAVKYSYLSPRFKKIVIIFGIMSSVVIVISIYLIIRLLFTAPSTSPSPSLNNDINKTNNTDTINTNSSDINF